MGATKVLYTAFGTAFLGLIAIAALGAACGGKSHVDVDILGDAAVTGPPGTCGSCGPSEVCLLNLCVVQCQNDHECAAGDRCLRTSNNGGCVHSSQVDCSVCNLRDTICTDGECRTICTFGCAEDQFCRGVACYGNDSQHDPRGSNATTVSTVVTGGSTGAGGSTGSGGGGQGGSSVSLCGSLTDSCSRCMCMSCSNDWQACSNDPGCAAIGDCVRQTGCRNNCYQAGTCQGVIDDNGGPSGFSFNRISALSACANGQCQGQCGSGGSGVDGGVVAPAAGWWRFDEGFGSMSADVSGNGHPAMLVNNPNWHMGITGSAIDLDGFTQFASLSPGPIVGSAPNFTIEAWVNWAGTTGLQTVYGETNFNDVIDLYLDNGVASFSTLSNNSMVTIKGRSVPASSWHHLAGVLQMGIGGSLYVDGQLVVGNPMMGPATQAIFETNIGRNGGSGGSRYFRGVIDEVRVFLVARSSQEIMSDYRSSLTGP